MNDAIKALLSEWQYVRGLTRCFIAELSDADLNKKLPRKNLNTITKHCEEMLAVQACYIKALETGKMKFDTYQDETLPGTSSKEDLLTKCDELDSMLLTAVKDNNCGTINWFGEEKSIYYHLAALISHESMHTGQIVAFCYAEQIELPAQVVNNMALSG